MSLKDFATMSRANSAHPESSGLGMLAAATEKLGLPPHQYLVDSLPHLVQLREDSPLQRFVLSHSLNHDVRRVKLLQSGGGAHAVHDLLGFLLYHQNAFALS